ncbi:MAG: alpha/beta hydrolase [Acidobacteria bacterium]|nr:alpha/beta hydrolase [Acidobacteriota bacterium]
MRYLILLLALTLNAAEPFAVKLSGNPKGQPVILIPGLSSSGDVWAKTVEHLKANYHCHSLTLAGFAGQPRLSDGPYLENVKDAVVSYIKVNKLKQPTIIGHSLGGHMALWIASQNPDLVGPLVIVDSMPHLGAVMFPDPATLKPQAAGMRAMITNQSREQYNNYVTSSGMIKSIVGDKDVEEVTKWSLTSDPVAIGNAMYDLYTTDLRDAIAHIKSKVLIYASWVGYKDFSTREKSVKLFEDQFAKLPNKTMKVSDTAKHFIMLDDPDWYLLQLDHFLK